MVQGDRQCVDGLLRPLEEQTIPMRMNPPWLMSTTIVFKTTNVSRLATFYSYETAIDSKASVE